MLREPSNLLLCCGSARSRDRYFRHGTLSSSTLPVDLPSLESRTVSLLRLSLSKTKHVVDMHLRNPVRGQPPA